MAKKNQKLTCTFFVGDKPVEKLSPEYLEKMAQRLGEAMSIYYTANFEEYKALKGK